MPRTKQIVDGTEASGAPQKQLNRKTGEVSVKNGVSSKKKQKLASDDDVPLLKKKKLGPQSALRANIAILGAKEVAKKTKGETTTTTKGDKPRKPHRYRPGTVSARLTRKLLKRTDLILQKLTFQRIVRHIANEVFGAATSPAVRDFAPRFSPDALSALQFATESYLHDHLSSAVDFSKHARRMTVNAGDVNLGKNFVLVDP